MATSPESAYIMAIHVSLGDAHCTPEANPVLESAPEAVSEYTAYNDMTKKVVQGLSTCHVTATEAISDLSVYPVMAMEAVSEISTRPVKTMKAVSLSSQDVW